MRCHSSKILLRSLASLLILLATNVVAADENGILLSLGGEVTHPAQWTMADLKALPAATVTATDEGGNSSEYRCIAFQTLLEVAGAASDKALKGERLNDYALVSASDNYRVLFALPEIDALLGNRRVFLCYLKNGEPLPSEEGPLRVIVPDDQRHARWVRHAIDISVRHLPR